eukprot:gnl/Spiro4/6657_TR3436_c0_g1_i1.p1 gnl/Spiro4/6657_TR3436_c0_g1~~gnl/Spiro4/6657_TR3436_c0_g1_i1.p1  ORF type:complete len:399 (-),score=128.76 gnl/Spiro4/6657_TR3436_c0_g1_i1:227-1372(-)
MSSQLQQNFAKGRSVSACTAAPPSHSAPTGAGRSKPAGAVNAPVPARSVSLGPSRAQPNRTAQSFPTHLPSNPAPIRGVDPAMQQLIMDEILDRSPVVRWADIVGLDQAKNLLTEIITLPSLRPELFTGIRAPPRGLLLFGPPGNGKTMLAKAVAADWCGPHGGAGTFFSISASSLTSKWMGESEKLVKALFAVAAQRQPSVIFIDEIDSLLSTRGGANEHESSRRLKNEFLVQFDGVAADAAARILVMAATNRPQELDDAAIRRLTKRVYVPLPGPEAKSQMIAKHLEGQRASLTARDLSALGNQTVGFSASDIKSLCAEAAMGPVRELGSDICTVPAEMLRPINRQDFVRALERTRPSVSLATIGMFEDWNRNFGSFAS